MAINFIEVTKNFDKITYQVVPELPPPDFHVDAIKEMGKLNKKTNGMTDSKAERLIGLIPYTVYYNYSLMNGITGTKQINEFYTADRGKNINRLLNEFTAFRVVDKI